MARYDGRELFDFLTSKGCTFEGDRFALGLGLFAPDGMPFTMPAPDPDGCFDAEVIDRILADRWIPGPVTLRRIP